ncbi:MAG: peptidoglycan-binding protein, partial [Clostridia bacterium]|nr:peptidoglycan-binding protein [Clostridia bacterium]
MKKQLAAGLVALLLCLSGSALAKTAAGGLEYGDRGDEVLRLQQALDTLGYKVGKVDGSFGAYTENALRAFQKAHGLSVDGIAGTKTREAIYALAEG